MRTYTQLSHNERARAQAAALTILLGAVLEGVVRFNDELNSNHLQARIDGACVEADEMRTPWFAGEYVMDAAGDELKGMALCDARDALYPEPGEHIIHL